MTRRFDEIIIDLNNETPPRCPKCGSAKIQSYNIPVQLESTRKVLASIDVGFMECLSCENIWIKHANRESKEE